MKIKLINSLITTLIPLFISLLTWNLVIRHFEANNLQLKASRYVQSRRYVVRHSTMLRRRLQVARPGDRIILTAGVFYGPFMIRRSGLSAAPIAMIGNRQTVFQNQAGPAILMVRARFWTLRGMTIANSRKGILMLAARNNVIEHVKIASMSEQGVLIQNGSVANVIRDCRFMHTGLVYPERGQAISIGTKTVSGDGEFYRPFTDRSNRNQIINNHFGPDTMAAEYITVYGAACCGRITGNVFDTRRQSASLSASSTAESWVTIRGDRWVIQNNRGYSHAGMDGFRVVPSALCMPTMAPISGALATSRLPVDPIYGPYRSHSRIANRIHGRVGYFPMEPATAWPETGWGSIGGTLMARRRPGCGCGNIFRENICSFQTPASGFCIRVTNRAICSTSMSMTNKAVGSRLTNRFQGINA